MREREESERETKTSAKLFLLLALLVLRLLTYCARFFSLLLLLSFDSNSNPLSLMNTSTKRKENDDMLSPMPPQPPPKRRLFQVNRHVQASIMLLSVMDGAELDLNNSLLPSASKTAATSIVASNSSLASNTSSITPSSLSTSDDYEKGERDELGSFTAMNASDTFFRLRRSSSGCRTRSMPTRTKSRTTDVHWRPAKTNRRRTV